MPSFEELMNTLRNPGDTGLPEDFADQLTAAYQEDISLRDAAVTEREEKLAAFDTERETFSKDITRLKSHLYDVMNAAPKPGENTGNANESMDDDGPRGIASLLTKETR